MVNEIYQGDTLKILKTFPDEFIDCIITSPPYWALRDYGTASWEGGNSKCNHKKNPPAYSEKALAKSTIGKAASTGHAQEGYKTECGKCGAKRVDKQLGLETTFQEYITKLCDIFDEVKRVLKKSGTCWINMGDSYSHSGGCGNQYGKHKLETLGMKKYGGHKADLPQKCLCQIPSRFSIEMCNRGWILRNTIIWYKPNCMPSSVKDRFTVDYEYVFFFVKSKEKSNDIKIWLPKMKSEDAAWLAAIVDGEGTIGIRRSKYENKNDVFQAYLTVTNSCKPIIEKCLALTGIGTIKDAGVSTNFSMYRWEVANQRAVSVIGEIYPYLIQKREQAKVAIAIQKTNYSRGNPKGSNKGPQPLSQKEIEHKKSLWELVKKLNQREVESSGLPEPNLNRYSGCEDYWFERQFEPHKYYEIDAKRKDFNNPSPTIDKHLEIGQVGKTRHGRPRAEDYGKQGRNKRCVWKITTKPFKHAHFAVFPEELVKTPIKAGCPEFVCKKCGKGREKILNKTFIPRPTNDKPETYRAIQEEKKGNRRIGLVARKGVGHNEYDFRGYTSCSCNAGFSGGVVLDPFAGSGTVAVVAKRLNRQWIGIELNPDYIKMGKKRIKNTQNNMF